MKRKTLVAAAVVSAVGLGAGGLALSQAGPSLAGPQLLASAWVGGGHDQRGWRHGSGGHERICTAAKGERMEQVIDFVEGFMAFTPEQETSWQALAASLRDGQDQVQSACAELAAADDPASAPAALARAEVFLTTGLAILRQVRPAFDDFYATLSDEQRRALDQLVARKHRRT